MPGEYRNGQGDAKMGSEIGAEKGKSDEKKKILDARYHAGAIFEKDGRRSIWTILDPDWPAKTQYKIGQGHEPIMRMPEEHYRLTGRFPDEAPLETRDEKYKDPKDNKDKRFKVERWDITMDDEAVLEMRPAEWNRDTRSRMHILRVMQNADAGNPTSLQAANHLLDSRDLLRQAIIESYIFGDRSIKGQPEREAQAREGKLRSFGQWADDRIEALEQKLGISAR